MTTTHNLPGRPSDTRVNVFSSVNPDMDYSFVVSSCRADEARALLATAFDEWFDGDPGLTLYESLETALVNAGLPFEDYLVPVCVYCDDTNLYSEAEMWESNLAYLLFPETLVRAFYIDRFHDGRSDLVGGGDFENWYENEYTADDTIGLYDYAIDRGFTATRTDYGKEN